MHHLHLQEMKSPRFISPSANRRISSLTPSPSPSRISKPISNSPPHSTTISKSEQESKSIQFFNPMDVEDDWELLSDEGYLDIAHHADNPSAATVLHMNYFICPPLPQFVETTANPGRDQPIQINIESFSADQDPITQVFFKKMKEPEFVDMKVESPKPSRFEAKEDPCKFDAEMAIEDEKDDCANAWKRSLSGIGAICSFGVAAATFCIIVFTNKHPHNHKLHFRIYTDDKRRMKVKGAIAAVSGVPISRARITVGGYYDAAL